MDDPVCPRLAARDEDAQEEEQYGQLGDEDDGYIGYLDAVCNLTHAPF